MLSITPHEAGSVIQIANSALNAVRTAIDLSKKTSDVDLKLQMVEVMNQVLELKDKMLDLDEDNRKLRLKLEQKDNIKRETKHGFWLKDGETQPLCPKCYEGEKHLVVYLSPAKFFDDYGYRRECNVCHRGFESSQLVHDSDFAKP